MAIAFDSSAFNSWTTWTTHRLDHTCSWTNRILFWSWLALSSSDTVTWVTYAGISMTQCWYVAAWTERIYMYYLINPPAWLFSIYATTSSSTTIYWQSTSYTWVRQASQPEASNTQGYLTQSNMSTSVTTLTNNAWLVWVFRSSTAATAAAWTTFRAWVNTTIQIGDSNWGKSPPWSYSLWSTFASWGCAQIVVSISPPDISSWIIWYYKLDSNSNDSIWSNHWTDTSITYSAWKIWNCAWYTSSTSKIVITENTSLALTEFSISFWFNAAGTTWFRPIFRRSAAFMQWYAVYMSWANIYWYIGNWADIATPAQSVSAWTWYKWLLRWSNTTKTLSLRINNWTPQTITTWTNITNSWVLNFLYDVPNATSWNSKIDEVAIYNRVISDSEDDILYNSWNWITYPFNEGNFLQFFL